MKASFGVKAVGLLVLALLCGTIEVQAQSPATERRNQAAGEEKTLSGVVSDAMCGRVHMMKDKSAAECLRYCVQQGTKYALVVGKDVYTLVGHEADLDRYAAQKVTVKGKVNGTTVAVDSVEPVKGGAKP